MATTTFSAREFNQQVGTAKRRAKDGPVFITDRRARTHVLLSVEEYQKITDGPRRSLAEALSCPEAAEIELDLPSGNAWGGFRVPEFD